jgi:hypothetical protein
MFRVHEIEEGLFHARGRSPQILHLLKTKANPTPPKKKEQKITKKKVKSQNSQIAVQTNETQTKKEFKRNCDLSTEIHRKQANTNRNNKRTNKQPFVSFLLLLWESFAALSELNESFGGREKERK